ncbi:MAG: hypothetical protein LBS21_16045 [Clostridiales bacterium]|nr:hypothetical protein [Clostridiales bacterium]
MKIYMMSGGHKEKKRRLKNAENHGDFEAWFQLFNLELVSDEILEFYGLYNAGGQQGFR